MGIKAASHSRRATHRRQTFGIWSPRESRCTRGWSKDIQRSWQLFQKIVSLTKHKMYQNSCSCSTFRSALKDLAWMRLRRDRFLKVAYLPKYSNNKTIWLLLGRYLHNISIGSWDLGRCNSMCFCHAGLLIISRWKMQLSCDAGSLSPKCPTSMTFSIEILICIVPLLLENVTKFASKTNANYIEINANCIAKCIAHCS